MSIGRVAEFDVSTSDPWVVDHTSKDPRGLEFERLVFARIEILAITLLVEREQHGVLAFVDERGGIDQAVSPALADGQSGCRDAHLSKRRVPLHDDPVLRRQPEYATHRRARIPDTVFRLSRRSLDCRGAVDARNAQSKSLDVLRRPVVHQLRIQLLHVGRERPGRLVVADVGQGLGRQSA